MLRGVMSTLGWWRPRHSPSEWKASSARFPLLVATSFRATGFSIDVLSVGPSYIRLVPSIRNRASAMCAA